MNPNPEPIKEERPTRFQQALGLFLGLGIGLVIAYALITLWLR